MMTKPSITDLDKCVDSRYTLVAMAAKRARMIGLERMDTAETEQYDPTLEKPVTQAVSEISNGTVGYLRSEAIEKAREYEEEKIIAISKLEHEGAAEEKKETEAVAPEAPKAEEDSDLFGDEEEYSAIDAALKMALERNAEEAK